MREWEREGSGRWEEAQVGEGREFERGIQGGRAGAFLRFESGGAVANLHMCSMTMTSHQPHPYHHMLFCLIIATTVIAKIKQTNQLGK